MWTTETDPVKEDIRSPRGGKYMPNACAIKERTVGETKRRKDNVLLPIEGERGIKISLIKINTTRDRKNNG